MLEPFHTLDPVAPEGATFFRIDLSVVSIEAVLKTCYWLSRDFLCGVQDEGTGYAVVVMKKKDLHALSLEQAREAFFPQALDFALRERIDSQTKDVRDLLLAKAFSEAGVLEDEPNGVFGDSLEEAKPDGLFKILANR